MIGADSATHCADLQIDAADTLVSVAADPCSFRPTSGARNQRLVSHGVRGSSHATPTPKVLAGL